MSGFFILINCIEGKGAQSGIKDLRNKFAETMIMNWKIWVPANFTNFYLVPIKYQVLYANLVSLLYNVCLSAIHYR